MKLFSLHREEGDFFIIPEARATLDNRPVEAGERAVVWSGATVRIGGAAVVLGLPSERLQIALRLAGQGGEISVRREGVTETHPISVRRVRLLDALLGAEDLSDEHLIKLLWPGHVVRTRLDLNQLVHRTRQDLARFGIDGEMSLIRHPGGGSTALRLAEGCAVTGINEDKYRMG